MSKVKLFGKTIAEIVEATEKCESTDAAKEISSNPNPERQSQSGQKQDESKEPNAPDNSKVEPTELDDKPTLKKPDAILPCPRCNSMETKFCYFNNYNVNQPRHFCRKCQRYWTAGGTTRNVPVGAGRRKNKNILAAASQVRPLTVPVNHPNGTILVFNSDLGGPLCESMASVLSVVDKAVRSGEMDGDDCSSLSSDSSSKDEVPGAWPYPCQNTGIQWTSPTSPPTFGRAIIPLQLYSTTLPPYWASPTVCNVPFVNKKPPVPNSPNLGKHARDENIPKTPESSCNNDNLEKSLWVPKTLRVDDSREAAKIWATLGINNDITKNDDCGGVSISVGSLFKSQTEAEQKNEFQETQSSSIVPIRKFP